MIDKKWFTFAVSSLIFGIIGMTIAVLPFFGITYNVYLIGFVIPAPPLLLIGLILTYLEIRDRNKPEEITT